MRKFITSVLFAAALLCVSTAGAQSTGINYGYSTGSNTWLANSLPVVAIPSGVDDQLINISGASFPVGWSGFDFGGMTFTNATGIWISSNGFISFMNPGSSLPNNSLAANPYAIIAPFWDDLKTSATGNVNYKFSGGGTSEFLTVEWLQMLWDHNGTTWAISFQLRIYERTHTTTPNFIDFRYNVNGSGATNYNPGSGGTSIGLSGFCAGDFFNFLNQSGSPTKATEINNISVKPTPTLFQRFTPLPHPNDSCAIAQNITFNPGLSIISTQATTLQATSSTIPAAACWNAAASYVDVWFTFTKPAGITNFEIYTDSLDCRGANYGMGMEVYNACGGAVIACDDNSTGPPGTNATSYISFTNTSCAAVQYWVRVKTDNALTSYFRFNIRPPGRTCAFAADITPCGIPYSSPLNMSTCGYVNDYDSITGLCHSRFESGEDYVFMYTPPSSGCVNLSLNNTPASSSPALFVYNGCPSTGNCMGSITGSGGSALPFNNISLVGGVTYYFVIENDTTGTSSCLSSFDFTISAGGSGPVYDDCANPQLLGAAFGTPPCVGVLSFNNNCATPSAAGAVPLPGCGAFTDGITPDVWFTFTTPVAAGTTAQQIMISPDPSAPAQDLAMAVYTSSGGSCGVFSLVGCDDNSNGGMPSLTVTPPVVSTTYYIRVFSNDGTAPGNFRICIVYGCTPSNDLCGSAIALTVGQPLQGTNACSATAGEPGNASCWGPGGNARNTVWYSFVATNTTMKIRTNLLTLNDSQIGLYLPPCGGAMTQLYCNDDATNPCNGNTERYSEIIATGLTIGQTYLVRVDGYAASTGTFTIVVVDGAQPYPPIQSQDCALPTAICNNTTLNVASPGFLGEGNICDLNNSGTCINTGETNSAWYTFSVTGPANLRFTLNSGFLSSYSFMLWAVDTIWNNNPNHVFPTVANYCNKLNIPSSFPLTVCNTSAFNLFGNTGLNAAAGTLNMPPVAGPSVSSNTSTFLPVYSPQVAIPANETVTFLLELNSLGLFGFFPSGFSLNWQGTPIGVPPLITWVNNVPAPSNVWDGVSNVQAWVPNCYIPDCSTHPIPAYIAPGGVQPVINANVTVKDLTINAGATLTINSGKTLTICGNFTNNGTLICQPTSIVKFVGSTNTTINGTFAPTGNSFYNVEFAKNAGSSVTLTTNIYILGYDSVYSGIVNNNNKHTEIGGNFYNYNGSASFTGLGNGGSGSTITFTCRNSGGVNQLFRNDGAALTLNNVTMNQVIVSSLRLNAGAFSDMILGSSGVLTLTQGRIITTAAAAREVNITNSSSAACTAGNTNSYVEGNLRRAIAAAANSYDFPLGDGTTALAPGIVGYERANITFTTAPTAGFNLLGMFYRWTLGGVAFPGNGPAASECTNATYNALPTFNHGYWRINASGVASGTYQVTLYNSAMSNNTGLGWTVVKAPAGTGAFTLSGICYAGSTAAQTRRDLLTGFSDFATVQSQTPLPIQLLYFDATPHGDDVICNWATASEINNDRFELERSHENSNFSLVTMVRGFGAGSSTQILSYGYVDEEICTGVLYYRLKQVDIDGRFTYSNTIAVNCNDARNNITLFPNPANSEINISYPEPQSPAVSVVITDVFGKIIYDRDQVSTKGVNLVRVKTSDFPAGVYYVRVKDNTANPWIAKFVKQ